jgi:hypothetical protein
MQAEGERIVESNGRRNRGSATSKVTQGTRSQRLAGPIDRMSEARGERILPRARRALAVKAATLTVPLKEIEMAFLSETQMVDQKEIPMAIASTPAAPLPVAIPPPSEVP